VARLFLTSDFLTSAFPCDRQLRSNDRPDAGRERGLVEAWKAVHAIAVEQRDSRVAELRRSDRRALPAATRPAES
jgi:hypothetical protein